MNANQRINPTPTGDNPLPHPAVLKNSHQSLAFEMYQNHHIKQVTHAYAHTCLETGPHTRTHSPSIKEYTSREFVRDLFFPLVTLMLPFFWKHTFVDSLTRPHVCFCLWNMEQLKRALLIFLPLMSSYALKSVFLTIPTHRRDAGFGKMRRTPGAIVVSICF